MCVIRLSKTISVWWLCTVRWAGHPGIHCLLRIFLKKLFFSFAVKKLFKWKAIISRGSGVNVVFNTTDLIGS